MPPQTPSQLLPGLIVGASLLLVNLRPKARPAAYAAMSATQTSTSTDNRKLMPNTLAWTTASQASHRASTPATSRTARGMCGQPATPARSSQAPASTQSGAGDRP